MIALVFGALGVGLPAQAGTGPDGWDSRFHAAFGCMSGAVHAMVEAPSGLVYLGGSFDHCANVPASRVVAWDPASNQFTALGEGAGNGVDGPVHALAIHQGQLLVGGEFDRAGTTEVRNLARWNGSQWFDVAGGADGPVSALASGGGNLYVGGDFDTVGGASEQVAVQNIARLSGGTWSALGSGVAAAPGQTAAQVLAIAVDGTDVYAGGHFTIAGGGPAAQVAVFTAAGVWSALGAGVNWGAAGFGHVEALLVTGDSVIVGGQFSEAGGEPAQSLARWHIDSRIWSPLWTDQIATNAAHVRALVPGDGGWYVAGSFIFAGDPAIRDLAFWDGSEWISRHLAIWSDVHAVVALPGQLLAGGRFGLAGDGPVPTQNVARLSGGKWEGLGDGEGKGISHLNVGSAPPLILALEQYDGELYAAGAFLFAGLTPAVHVARWDGSEWHSVGATFDNLIVDLVVHEEELIAVGFFSQVGDDPAAGLARWDGVAWSQFEGGVAGLPLVATSAGGDLFVGGALAAVGQTRVPVSNIARWDGTEWTSVDQGVDGAVRALAGIGNSVYVGGDFQNAGGAAASRVARWHRNTGWHPVGGGVDGTVQVLAGHAGGLYVGGKFESAGGAPAAAIARWDGSAWAPVDGGMSDTWNDRPEVFALHVQDGELIAGGHFHRAGDTLVNHVARLRDGSWQPLATGGAVGVDLSNATINERPVVAALQATAQGLFLGGWFSSAGGRPAVAISRFAPKTDGDSIFSSGFECRDGNPEGHLRRGCPM